MIGVFGGGPPGIHPGFALLAGCCAGAIYGAIPGFLRSRFGANEIITTLMLNYIAIYSVIYLVLGPMGMEDAVFPQTNRIASSSELPRWIPGTRIHAGFFLALLIVAVVWVVLHRTSLGFEFRIMGENPSVAGQIGIPISRNITLCMAMCGALSGLAGAVEILGVQYRLAQDWSYEWGYTAIAVAFLGGVNPIGILAAGVYFGILQAGADSIQAATGVPAAIVFLIESLPVLIVLAISAPRILALLRKRSRGINGPGGSSVETSSRRQSVWRPPLLLAALGGILSERAGVLNIGLEGMMLVGAFFGTAGALWSGNLWIGVWIGMMAGAILAVALGFLSVTLYADQITTGIVLNIFALGLTSFLLRITFGIGGAQKTQTPPFEVVSIPYLSDLPFIGVVLFSHNLLVYLAFLLVGLLTYLLYHTPLGLSIRATGEFAKAADMTGIPVAGIRYACVIASGALARLGRDLSFIGSHPCIRGQHHAGQGLYRLSGRDPGSLEPHRRLVRRTYIRGR